MTEGRKTVLGTLEANVWPILCGIGFAIAGYATGQATTNARIDAIERDVVRHERKLTGRSDFMVCATRNFDKVFDRLGEAQACPMEVPE